MNKRQYRELVAQFMSKYQARLDAREAFEMALLSKKWGVVMDGLEGLITKLSSLKVKSDDQLFRLELYKEFLQQSNKQFVQYASYSEKVISAFQYEFAKVGLDSSQTALGLLGVKFNRLPVEAVLKTIGKTSDGSPLMDVLLKRYGESAAKVADTLIQSAALGRNPREIARLIGEDINGSLYNTLRIARTEQIDSFRETAREQYIESGVVDGMELITEADACDVCLDVASKNPYPLDYEFEELHPNCRCAFAPAP